MGDGSEALNMEAGSSGVAGYTICFFCLFFRILLCMFLSSTSKLSFGKLDGDHMTLINDHWPPFKKSGIVRWQWQWYGSKEKHPHITYLLNIEPLVVALGVPAWKACWNIFKKKINMFLLVLWLLKTIGWRRQCKSQVNRCQKSMIIYIYIFSKYICIMIE